MKSKYKFTGMRVGRWNVFKDDNIKALRLALYRYIKANKLVGVTKLQGDDTLRFFLYKRSIGDE